MSSRIRAVGTRLLLAVLLGACATRAGAEVQTLPGRDPLDSRFDPALPVPVLGATAVAAGQRLRIRWPAVGAASEMELVLSLDDGRCYDIRLSPELDGVATHFTWIVPNVGTSTGRIRLRARIGDREVNGPSSPEFTIAADPGRPPGRWSFHAGEWWEDPSGEPLPMPGIVTPERGPSLRMEHPHRVSAVPARAPVVVSRARIRLPLQHRVHDVPRPDVPSGVTIARQLPLRE
jgi:hypothetical protein